MVSSGLRLSKYSRNGRCSKSSDLVLLKEDIMTKVRPGLDLELCKRKRTVSCCCSPGRYTAFISRSTRSSREHDTLPHGLSHERDISRFQNHNAVSINSTIGPIQKRHLCSVCNNRTNSVMRGEKQFETYCYSSSANERVSGPGDRNSSSNELSLLLEFTNQSEISQGVKQFCNHSEDMTL